MLALVLSVFVVLICIIVFWKQNGQKQEDSRTTIPGQKKGSKMASSFDKNDLGKQLNFLKELHSQYGPIACFWEGDKMSVSISSPELFRETRNMNDVPPETMEPFRELIGNEGFVFQSVETALERRKLYDQYFMMKACKTHFEVVKEVAEEFASKWKNNTEKDEIALVETVNLATFKAVLRVTFGEMFADDNILNEFQKELQVISNNLGLALEPGTPEHKAQEEATKILKDTVRKAFINRRKEIEEGSDREIFIDVLLDFPEAERVADGFIFFFGADTINFFWFLYHLAKEPEVQEKIFQEIRTVVGDDSINLQNYSKLTYLRQVIDETLRYHGIIHVGRVAEKDMTVGGHFIPKGTNIYQFLGGSHHDTAIWKEPKTFDPERFTRENSKGRHGFAFKPFGFSGKRICPGMTFSYFLFTMFAATWVQKFKFALIPEQEPTLIKTPFERIVELLINIIPRK